MLYPYISQFNWIDIVLIICFIRMGYVGLKRGFGVELFKFTNLLFCAFIAFHFYYTLAELLNTKLPVLPIEAAAITCYIVLLFLITILFRILREGFFIVLKSETISSASKFLGLFVGFIRGSFIGGFIIFGLLISTVHYFELSARTSFLGPKIVKIPIKIYEGIFYSSVSKLFPDQAFNQEITKVLEENPKEE